MQEASDALSQPVSGPTRGRPRDPGLEARVFDTAMAIYAEAGWTGFNFDAIARRAGVGKAALYRRWPRPDLLLAAMLDKRWGGMRTIDKGSLREDLLAMGRLAMGLMNSTHAGIAMNLQVDCNRYEEVRIISEPFQRETRANGVAIAMRAIERGEVEPGVDPNLVIIMVNGAIISRIMQSGTRGLDPDEAAEFIEKLVDRVVIAVAPRGSKVDIRPAPVSESADA